MDRDLNELPLRVSIYPYIPDLAGDKLLSLKKYIAQSFEDATGIKVIVESSAQPYDLDSLKSKYLSHNSDSYDIMELDTILLGELVKSGNVKKIDSIKDLNIDTEPFFDWCKKSAMVFGSQYGVPTLQCASFLMELVSLGHSPARPLLLGEWQSFSALKAALDRQENSGHRILVAGDFRGSWGLPMFYLDAYVDKHGKGSVYEGIDAPIDDDEIVEHLKEFTDFGTVSDGKNPDIDGKFHDDHSALIKEVVDSPHILMYSYSEDLGEMLHQASVKDKRKKVLEIISTPLDAHNYLITYTDALVVNSFSDPKRAGAVAKFIEFYTSLDFRTAYAFGRDLPTSVHYPRYVLPARRDFFTSTFAANDDYYKLFFKVLKQRAIPAPNHDIYQKREELQKALQKLLGVKPEGKCKT